MLDWLVLAAQTASGPAMPADDRLRAIVPCPDASETSDVIVCGRRNQSYRLPKLPDDHGAPGPRKAETSIGPGKLAVEGESVTIGGVPSNRVMVRLQIPF